MENWSEMSRDDAAMWTASHQLNDLSLDLMHGGAFEDNRAVWGSVNIESSQKRLCYEGEKILLVNQKVLRINIHFMFVYFHDL